MTVPAPRGAADHGGGRRRRGRSGEAAAAIGGLPAHAIGRAVAARATLAGMDDARTRLLPDAGSDAVAVVLPALAGRAAQRRTASAPAGSPA